MSDEPRDLHRGTTYVVLRDVRDGMCGLLPDVSTKQLLGFLLGCTQQRVEAVGLHAFRCGPNVAMYMVTHWTEQDRTPPPKMSGAPAFFREFHRMTARNLNARTSETGRSFWSNKKPIMIELPTVEDVWDALVEMELLHLSAGITKRGWRDPYLRLGPRDIGRSHSFACPPDLEREFMSIPPERCSIQISAPPSLGHLSREEIVRELEERCVPVRQQLAARERDYLELDATTELDERMQRPLPEFSNGSILSRERPHWKNHFIASHDRTAEKRRQKRREDFRRAHQRALQNLRELLSTGGGDPSDITFPAGTWGAWQRLWVRVEHAAHHASPGRPPP